MRTSPIRCVLTVASLLCLGMTGASAAGAQAVRVAPPVPAPLPTAAPRAPLRQAPSAPAPAIPTAAQAALTAAPTAATPPVPPALPAVPPTAAVAANAAAIAASAAPAPPPLPGVVPPPAPASSQALVVAPAPSTASMAVPLGSTMRCKDGTWLNGTPAPDRCETRGGVAVIVPVPSTPPPVPLTLRAPRAP